MLIVERPIKYLDTLGLWIGLLAIRLLLGWEYFEAGLEKWQGENWFAEIAARFPAPFSWLPINISWNLVTVLELFGGLALILGLGTRIFSGILFVVTWVALISVHWPEHWMSWQELLQGYRFTDQGFGNFKLPLMFLCMLWPLMLMGPGRLSVDNYLRRIFWNRHS